MVTNYTNENAHNDFIKNHKEAIKILVKYLKDKKYKKRGKIVAKFDESSIYDYNLHELKERLKPSFRAKQVYNWLYKNMLKIMKR